MSKTLTYAISNFSIDFRQGLLTDPITLLYYLDLLRLYAEAEIELSRKKAA